MESDVPERRPTRRRLVLIGVFGVLAIGAAAVWAYASRPGTAQAASKDKDKKEKEPPAVAAEPVEVGPIAAYISATANLVAEDEVKVVAEAEGQVIELNVDEGDTVARGRTLLQIDPADARLAVQKAELALRNAQINLDRSERMATEKLISPQDLDKIRYERDVAAQGLAEARHRLTKTTVTAPFAGRITIRRVQPGQNVKPGEELFTLADFEPLVARIFLPEREVLDLKVGQEVRLLLRAREETRFAGRIQRISPVVDTASGTVKVTVEAVRPPSNVRPGAFVSVEVLREVRPQALLVPRTAVVRELQETYVFVADGKLARKRTVAVGLEERDRVEIVRGLAAGERVITSGQGALKDESPIVLANSAKS
jgi:membrane fusion protein (multidrug efflux system)